MSGDSGGQSRAVVAVVNAVIALLELIRELID
ncbi:DinQ-like type I toxin DqlB [Escherichia coli]